MAAFAAAIEMGADMIEADVRRTGAGRIVLAHDPLRGDPGDGLPGLADLVRLAAGRIALDVELKEAGYEADVLAVLHPRPAGLVVTSFLPEAVAEVRALDPGVETGLIFRANDRRDLLRRTADCGATAVVAHVNALDAELTRAVARERAAAHGVDGQQAPAARVGDGEPGCEPRRDRRPRRRAGYSGGVGSSPPSGRSPGR